MIKYGVVFETDFGDFLEKVNEALKAGWKPQGGICVVGNNNYYQALYKELKDE